MLTNLPRLQLFHRQERNKFHFLFDRLWHFHSLYSTWYIVSIRSIWTSRKINYWVLLLVHVHKFTLFVELIFKLQMCKHADQYESDLILVVNSLILSLSKSSDTFNASSIQYSLVKLLQSSGYDAAVCETKWHGFGKIPGGKLREVSYNVSNNLLFDFDEFSETCRWTRIHRCDQWMLRPIHHWHWLPKPLSNCESYQILQCTFEFSSINLCRHHDQAEAVPSNYGRSSQVFSPAKFNASSSVEILGLFGSQVGISPRKNCWSSRQKGHRHLSGPLLLETIM